MATWQQNQYNPSSFPHPESAYPSDPNWDHARPSPGRDPPFQSRPNFRPQHRIDSSSSSTHTHHQSHTDTRLSSAVDRSRPQASWVDRRAGRVLPDTRCTESSQLARHMLGEELTNPCTVHWQATPRQSSISHLSVQPPRDCLVRYSAPHDQQATDAFTERSTHPNPVLRMLLDCVLHSTFIHNQTCEPRMTDYYSKHVLSQVVNLNGCPPIDFSSSKQSLLTVFIGKSGRNPCCLICHKSRGSIPRTLGCVRSHLQFKPFRCEGCQSCNERNGHATFWTDALLRDRLGGQTTAACAKCGAQLRHGNMRRHWDTVHKYLPFSTLGHPRNPKHNSTRIRIADSPEEDIEELFDFLLDDDEND